MITYLTTLSLIRRPHYEHQIKTKRVNKMLINEPGIVVPELNNYSTMVIHSAAAASAPSDQSFWNGTMAGSFILPSCIYPNPVISPCFCENEGEEARNPAGYCLGRLLMGGHTLLKDAGDIAILDSYSRLRLLGSQECKGANGMSVIHKRRAIPVSISRI